MNSDEVAGIINKVSETQSKWKWEGFSLREDCLTKVAEDLRKNKTTYARLIAAEMGKPVLAAASEVEKCAWICEYYVQHAREFLSEEMIPGEGRRCVRFEPLGLILAIMPWNFPFWQVFRFAAPALMAGNGVLLKHAPNTTGCSLAIEKIFQNAGFGDGLLRSLIIDVDQVEKILENPKVQGVSLTGSTVAGSSVAKHAGTNLKKSILELGGSDPYIVLDDADLDNAAKICVMARMHNTGQTCVAAKRWLISESIYEEFKTKLIKQVASYSFGDPQDPATKLGPLARRDLQENLHRQVVGSVDKGASLILGGEMPRQPGYYYPPTLIENVEKGMPVYDEEVFGPVGVLIKIKDENDAIRIANDTEYGLGAAIFTKDLEKGERIAHYIEVGNVAINDSVKSDPHMPFGGVKKSGYGRELSHYGIREFVNIKSIVVKS